MPHTILIATLSAVVASVLTTVVIGGSLFGASAASSANTPAEAAAGINPSSVEGLIQATSTAAKRLARRFAKGSAL